MENNNFKKSDIITFVDNIHRKHISVLKNIYNSSNSETCVACKIDIVLNNDDKSIADEINLTTIIYETETNTIKQATTDDIRHLMTFLWTKKLIYDENTEKVIGFDNTDMLVINTDGECLITLFAQMDSCKSRIYAYGTVNKYQENSCKINYCAAIINSIDSIRFATDDEKELFETMFLNEGLIFNYDKKEFYEKRWRAEIGKPYYCIDFNYGMNYDNGMTISKCIEKDSKTDNLRFDHYNYFRTNEISKTACKDVFITLKNIRNNEII